MRPRTSRRRLLASAGGALLAASGCLGRFDDESSPSSSPDDGSSDESTADGEPSTETDAPADSRLPRDAYDCADASRPDPEPLEGRDVDPRPYPDPPASIADDGREFVAEYERAYLTNDVLEGYGDELTRVEVREPNPTIEDRGDGYLVATVEHNYAYYGTDDDGVEWVADAGASAAYYVDDRVVRAASVPDDPGGWAEGDLLECFSRCSDPSRLRPDVEAGEDELGPVAYPDPLPAPLEVGDEELLA